MDSDEFDVVVVGSCNVDFSTYTNKVPKIGETVEGVEFKTGNGGKGANQAWQAAKLGAKTAMVGRVGNDVFGKAFVDSFKTIGVHCDFLKACEGVSTGSAQITVDVSSGANSIIIVKGANDKLSPADVKEASKHIKAKVLLCQNEIPLETTLAALKAWKENGAVVLFNPAPAPKNGDIRKEFFDVVDIFVPNETETAVLCGKQIDNVADAKEAAIALKQMGAKGVIITLGKDGCYISVDEFEGHIPVNQVVRAVDSTGAGDSFCGALAFFLSRGLAVEDAVRRSVGVASLSVTKQGTQTSFFAAEELPTGLIQID